jgi:hypothetical protein
MPDPEYCGECGSRRPWHFDQCSKYAGTPTEPVTPTSFENCAHTPRCKSEEIHDLALRGLVMPEAHGTAARERRDRKALEEVSKFSRYRVVTTAEGDEVLILEHHSFVDVGKEHHDAEVHAQVLEAVPEFRPPRRPVGDGVTETVASLAEARRHLRLMADALGFPHDVFKLAHKGTPAEKKENRPRAVELMRTAKRFYSIETIADAVDIPMRTLYGWLGKYAKAA